MAHFNTPGVRSNNMLVPVEERAVDRASNPELAATYQEQVQPRRLIYMCCACNNTELAESPFVYTERLETESGEGNGPHTTDLDLDKHPTEDKRCPSCGNPKAYFMGNGPTNDDATEKQRFMCTACGNEWIDEGAE